MCRIWREIDRFRLVVLIGIVLNMVPYLPGDKHQLMFQGVTAKSVGLPILSTVLFFFDMY